MIRLKKYKTGFSVYKGIRKLYEHDYRLSSGDETLAERVHTGYLDTILRAPIKKQIKRLFEEELSKTFFVDGVGYSIVDKEFILQEIKLSEVEHTNPTIYDKDNSCHNMSSIKAKSLYLSLVREFKRLLSIKQTLYATIDTFTTDSEVTELENRARVYNLFISEPSDLLQASKTNKIQQALDSYQAANNAPVTYKRIVYQADQASKDALAAKVNAVQAGWVVPKSFQWKALDNTLHVFKAADIKSLYLAIETRNQTNWAHYQSLKKRINACTSQKELDAIKV